MVTTAPLTRSTSGATETASVAGGGDTAQAARPAPTSSAAPSRALPAIDDDASRRVIRRERNRDLVAKDDTDAVLAQLAAEMGEHLVAVLELDAEITRREDFDDAALKL